MGGGHVELRQVGFQHGGRGSFRQQRGRHLIVQDAAGQKGRGSGRPAAGKRGRSKLRGYFLAMLCIICLFFKLGRVEEEVPTRDKVDWDT